MKVKVEKYIYKEEFSRQSNGVDNSPVMFCYQDFINQPPDFFNKEEQEEIFAYFLEKRSDRLLFSFTFRNKFTLAKTPSFSQIQELIETKISSMLEIIRTKEKWTLEVCFDFLDYINALSEIRAKDNTLEDLKYILPQLVSIIGDHSEKHDQKYVDSIFNILVYILKNSSIKIDDDLLGIFTEFKDKMDSKLYGALRDFYYHLILSQHPESSIIDPRYKAILLFALEGNDPFLKLYNKYLIYKIDDVKILKEILTSCFPEIKNFYDYDERFEIIFLVITQLQKLDVDAEAILSYLSKNQQDRFLKYLGYLYQQKEGKLTIKISNSIPDINLSGFIPLLKSHIISLSQDQNFEFTWKNTWDWGVNIFKNTINTPGLYKECSQSAKELYHLMVRNENDPIWNEIPEEERSRVLQRNQEDKNTQNKKEERLRLKKEKQNSCINDFFDKDKDFIRQEINQIKDYFGKIGVTHSDIYDYVHESSFIINPKAILTEGLPILNPFLISHLYDMYYLLRDSATAEATVNIDDIFGKVLENWDGYWGLYLYNYLITLKCFDFPFTSEQREKLTSYFTGLQSDDPIPVYIYWHLKQVFGITIKYTEDSVLKLLKTDYGYLTGDPSPVFIHSDVQHDRRQGLLFSNIVEYEKKDFSSLIEENDLSKLDLFHKLLEDLPIEDACFYYYPPYSPRFHLLSIINIYELFDPQQKQEYRPIIKRLCEQYINVTIQNSHKQPLPSQLILEMIAALCIEFEILELIDKAGTIHEMHLSQVRNIQQKYFGRPQWDDCKNVLYRIRKSVELGQKEVMSYDYKQQPILLEQEDQLKIAGLRDQLSLLEDGRQITSEDCKKLKDSLTVGNQIIKKYVRDDIPHEKKYNILYALAFLDMDDKDFDIWERFCDKAIETQDYHFQDEAITILSHIIQNHRINNIDQFVELIVKYYGSPPEPKQHPSGIFYTPRFEFILILQACIYQLIITDIEYNLEIYDKLLKIQNLSLAQKEQIRFRAQKLKFVKITCLENKYLLNNKEFDTIDELINYYAEIKLLKQNSFVSQIKLFEHLIKDIKKKTWTMSHPYYFEDPIENQYPIEKPLYISCWSFSEGRNNAYAWWKLYGKKTSFRNIIPITSLIKSAVSLLDTYPNSTLYLGSIEYDLDIDALYHQDPEDFFKKRSDFKFESEFRVMLYLDENDMPKAEFLEEDHINQRCSLNITNFDIYRDININDSSDEPKFSPFSTDILDKDKKAMLKVIEMEKGKLPQ